MTALSNKKTTKKGHLKDNHVLLEPHEKITIKFLIEQGYNIELIPPSNIPMNKSADFLMNGIAWEMKRINGHSYNSLEHIVKNATKQSGNILLDLRFAHLDEQRTILILHKRVSNTRTIKHLKIITKAGKLLDMK